MLERFDMIFLLHKVVAFGLFLNIVGASLTEKFKNDTFLCIDVQEEFLEFNPALLDLFSAHWIRVLPAVDKINSTFFDESCNYHLKILTLEQDNVSCSR